jgi:hypothetical protein
MLTLGAAIGKLWRSASRGDLMSRISMDAFSLRAARGGMAAVCVVLLAGCVRWQPVPAAPTRALPRWVRVTTRDSVRRLLEDAGVVSGDTLVGRSAEDDGGGERMVRIPASEIVQLEARVPNGAGSVGVAVIVLLGLTALVALVGHASTL